MITLQRPKDCYHLKTKKESLLNKILTDIRDGTFAKEFYLICQTAGRQRHTSGRYEKVSI